MTLKGIDQNYLKDSAIGSSTGIGYLILNAVTPTFSLGLPQIPLALGSTFRFIITAIGAPVFEESFFRGVLLGKFREYFDTKTDQEKAFWISNIVQALLFGLFHSAVYGAFITLSSAYISAVFFGLVAGYMTEKTNSLLPSILAHMIFNGFLITQMAVAIG